MSQTMSLYDSPQVIKLVYDPVNQALRVSGGFEIEGFLYNHISSNATTLVNTGAGVLSNISINKAGASSNIATIYDGISAAGTVIAIIDTTTARSIPYTVAYTVGLCIVTSTGTAADLTVSYV